MRREREVVILSVGAGLRKRFRIETEYFYPNDFSVRI